MRKNERLVGGDLGSAATSGASERPGADRRTRVSAVMPGLDGSRSSHGRERFVGLHLSIDFANVLIVVDGRRVRLTKREFTLLRFFVRNQDRVLSRDVLLAGVWGRERRACRVVDSAIYKLRAKLGTAGRQIKTLAGFGYRFGEFSK